MAELPKVKYSGKIREVRLGKPGKEVVVGGETSTHFGNYSENPPLHKKGSLTPLPKNANNRALWLLDIVAVAGMWWWAIPVIPAEAGIRYFQSRRPRDWTPAFAGVTPGCW